MHPYLSFEALLSFQIDVTELFTVLKKPPEPTRMWTIKQCYDDNNNSSNNSEELAMELSRLWQKRVTVILIIVGSLEWVKGNFNKAPVHWDWVLKLQPACCSGLCIYLAKILIFGVRIKHYQYITLRMVWMIKIAITVSITISQIHFLQLRCSH